MTHNSLRPPATSCSRLRIVVLGYIIRGPLGGLAWHHLQYVLGLAQLGHEVVFLEDSDDYVSCYDAERNVTDTDPTYGLAFGQKAFAGIGLPDCWAYYDAHTRTWHGPAAHTAQSWQKADLLLNVSGVNPLRPWVRDIPVRVLVDTDPTFTQIRHIENPKAAHRAAQHNCFVSFGENIGADGARVPDDGLPWLPTRQPVVLDAWPVRHPPDKAPFTTVMQWNSYPACKHNGVTYGMKSHSFEEYCRLPERAAAEFELALGVAPARKAELQQWGWRFRNPLEVTKDPWTYQRYIQQSRGEFGVAKHGYVVSRSGWFSERSACYLASGRPAIVQNTGFTDWLPSGAGVLAFDTCETAAAAVDDVNSGYLQHCRAAREVAGEYFDSRKVLTRLIEDAMNRADASPSPTDQTTSEGI